MRWHSSARISPQLCSITALSTLVKYGKKYISRKENLLQVWRKALWKLLSSSESRMLCLQPCTHDFLSYFPKIFQSNLVTHYFCIKHLPLFQWVEPHGNQIFFFCEAFQLFVEVYYQWGWAQKMSMFVRKKEKEKEKKRESWTHCFRAANNRSFFTSQTHTPPG